MYKKIMWGFVVAFLYCILMSFLIILADIMGTYGYTILLGIFFCWAWFLLKFKPKSSKKDCRKPFSKVSQNGFMHRTSTPKDNPEFAAFRHIFADNKKEVLEK